MGAAKVIKGSMMANGKKFAIVVSRFNEFLSEQLLRGAIDTLSKHGVKEEDITVVWVPGAFEVPPVAGKMAVTEKYDAVICLGAVIRGETPHFDFIAAEAAKGVSKIAMESKVPCVFGIITTDNLEQALDRAGTKSGNKGRDAAMTAIEMCSVYSVL